MPELLPLEATVRCEHQGKVTNEASQDWVTIEGVPVLVDDDPEGRDIKACPNRGANIKPCKKTKRVDEGYSEYVRIGDRRVVLASLEGLTNGTPPGLVKYVVREASQHFVAVDR